MYYTPRVCPSRADPPGSGAAGPHERATPSTLTCGFREPRAHYEPQVVVLEVDPRGFLGPWSARADVTTSQTTLAHCSTVLKSFALNFVRAPRPSKEPRPRDRPAVLCP